MGAENRGDTFCEDRTEVALELRRCRERKSSIRPPVASLPDLERLDGTGRQLGAMLAAQKLQQDGDALRGGLADVEREELAERSLHDLGPDRRA